MIGLENLLKNLKYKELSEIAKQEGIQTKGKKTQLIKKLLEEVDPIKLRKHFANLRGAGFDIFQHELVPTHEILSKEEEKALLEKYGISKWQIPKILDKDPAILAINGKPGDIVRIRRKSPTAGETDYYRVVMSGISIEESE